MDFPPPHPLFSVRKKLHKGAFLKSNESNSNTCMGKGDSSYRKKTLLFRQPDENTFYHHGFQEEVLNKSLHTFKEKKKSVSQMIKQGPSY